MCNKRKVAEKSEELKMTTIFSFIKKSFVYVFVKKKKEGGG